MSGNITDVSYVNNEGRNKSEVFNGFKKELWVHDKICCTLPNMSVSAVRIPGTQIIEAESFSTNFNEAIELKFSTHLFQKFSGIFVNPTLDLFASRINQSWKPDSKALALDAFSIK